MGILHKLTAWTFGLCAAAILHAQSCTVVEEGSGDPVAFVHVRARQSGNATFTDLYGRFTLAGVQAGDTLSLELMGYAPLRMAYQGTLPDTLRMEPTGVGLEEVVIVPGENPALRIMRLAVQHRQANNAFLREGLHYTSHNKLRLAPADGAALPDTSLLSQMYLFLMETATQVWVLPAGRTFAQVTASKVSGYPGKALPLAADDLQSLTPYEPRLTVLQDQFLSPVSPAGLDKYIYEWTDTLLQGPDSIFVIRCVPRKGEWNAVEGTLHIHSRGYAVIHLDVGLLVRETALAISGGQIRQVYALWQDSLWVPSQLFTELDLLPYNSKSTWRLALTGRSDLQGFTLGEPPPRRPSGVDVEVLPDAGSLMEGLRTQPLTQREQRTYAMLDSLGREAGLNWWLDQIYNIQEGRLGLGPVDLDLEHLLMANRVERWRFGLGLATSDRLWKRASVGGWAMWGLERDQDWEHRLKWQADVRITPLGNRKWVMGAGQRQDLVEAASPRVGLPASHPLWRGLSRSQDARTYFLERMDYVRQQFAYCAVELPGHLSLRADASRGTLEPAYTYSFAGDSAWHTTDVGLVARWAPGERFSLQNGHTLLIRNPLPVLMVRVGQGELSGDAATHRYQQAEVVLAHTLEGPGRWKLRYRLQAGGIWGNVPLSRLYVFRGNDARGQQADVQDAFNTMGVQEFAAQRHATAHLELTPHLPGLGLGRWRPWVTLSCGAAMGWLPAEVAALHQGQVVQAPEGIYLEPGLTLRNLLPAPKKDTLLRAFVKSLGVGVFCRLHQNRNPDWPGDWALRVGFRL